MPTRPPSRVVVPEIGKLLGEDLTDDEKELMLDLEDRLKPDTLIGRGSEIERWLAEKRAERQTKTVKR